MKQIKKFTKEYVVGHVLGNKIVHKDQVAETNNSIGETLEFKDNVAWFRRKGIKSSVRTFL